MQPLLALRSLINTPLFHLRDKLRLTRKNYSQKPARRLKKISSDQLQQILSLQKKYRIRFEDFMDLGNALENYHLLYLVDQAKENFKWEIKQNQIIVDVGSKNFYYAKMLETVFHPKKCTGIELDAYPLYDNLHTRYSYAQFFIKNLNGFDYQVLDFCDYRELVDGLIFFYPFVIEEPLIRWALPKKFFRPEEIFKNAKKLLNANGWVFIVNQGEEEYEAQKGIMGSLGFVMKGHFIQREPLLKRTINPFVSLWYKMG